MNHSTINDPSYLFRTIHEHNRNRLSILPSFPTTANDPQLHLLLANVPEKLLSKEELGRRDLGQYTLPYQMALQNVYYHSHLIEYYQRHYLDLMNRFHIDAAILDCNYVRLRHCLHHFADERLRCLRLSLSEVQLSEHEYPIAMEFFLQIDVDLFYMRNSLSNQRLFCQNKPEPSFAITPCHRCDLCCLSSRNMNYHSASLPSIRFGLSEKFTFRNGYETMLNNNVTCNTHNLIYVLKCVCNEFEYVGETNLRLSHCLALIRENCMRHIHEFLLGETNTNYFNHQHKQSKKSLTTIDQIHLYQHVVRCTKAIQLFLDHNARYWRFVPMLLKEVEQQDALYNRSTKKTTPTDEEKQFIYHLPVLPHGYEFSEKQYDQQIRFFQREHHKQLPSVDLDLYHTHLIAVLPDDTSTICRQFIQALFITHGETNLNPFGHLISRPDATNHPFNSIHTILPRSEWCGNLIRRSS